MKNVKLIITEGSNPEHKILNELNKLIFTNPQKDNLEFIFVGSLIKFCLEMTKIIKKDKDINIFLYAKENYLDDNSILDNLTIDDISEVYLLFDYDCQGYLKGMPTNYSYPIEKYNVDIKTFLNLFSDPQGDYGKLYVNYPAIESFWDIPKDNDFINCYANCFVDFKYRGYRTKKYKSYIHSKNTDSLITNFINLDKKKWKKYITVHLLRLQMIMKENNDLVKDINLIENLSKYDFYNQIIDYDLSKIHEFQEKLFIENEILFAISFIPLFILEISSNNALKKLIIDLTSMNAICDYENCFNNYLPHN